MSKEVINCFETLENQNEELSVKQEEVLTKMEELFIFKDRMKKWSLDTEISQAEKMLSMKSILESQLSDIKIQNNQFKEGLSTEVDSFKKLYMREKSDLLITINKNGELARGALAMAT
jgi:hypothetical protein